MHWKQILIILVVIIVYDMFGRKLLNQLTGGFVGGVTQ